MSRLEQYLPSEIVVWLPFAGLALALIVWLWLTVKLYGRRPKVQTEGPPRTAEEIAEKDDTIPIPRRGTYDVNAAYDLTMRLSRVQVDREPTVPVNVAEPKPWEWAK